MRLDTAQNQDFVTDKTKTAEVVFSYVNRASLSSSAHPVAVMGTLPPFLIYLNHLCGYLMEMGENQFQQYYTRGVVSHIAGGRVGPALIWLLFISAVPTWPLCLNVASPVQ